jgi:hypothetical protein
MRSDAINELAEALSKAQSEIQDAEKNAKNPHFKSSYADLSAVLQATREPLSKNFLSVSQIVVSEGDDYFLETTLLHKSGQFISAKLKLLLIKKDMQGLGGAITYARRYSLAAIVGIAQEDADGEDTKSPQQKPPNTPFVSKPKEIDETIIETQKLKEQEERSQKLYIWEQIIKYRNDMSTKALYEFHFKKTYKAKSEVPLNELHELFAKVKEHGVVSDE